MDPIGMNEDEKLPPDLAQLESELAARAHPANSQNARARILSQVGRELAGKKRLQRANAWRFAAASAAAVALWANLSMSAVNNTEWQFHSSSAVLTAQTAQQIKELAPEISDREAAREALMLYSRGQLIKAPAILSVNR